MTMQNPQTCLSTELLRQLSHDELSPAELKDVEDHVSDCERCRQLLEVPQSDPQWKDEIVPILRTPLVAGTFHVPSASGHGTWNVPATFDHDERGSEGESLESILRLLGPTDDPHMLGRIGSYEVVGVIGRGGMGVVFKAYEGALNRFVAIKMLLPHLAASGAARKRFAREGKAAAAVIDDNVMPIYSVAEWQGVPYLVTQYSRGATLQKRIQDQGPLELKEILRIGMQTARGLAAAHTQGLVHRDVKPSNILLDGTVERALLTDFGLARAVDDASITRTGIIAGTPQYMSPEQARGGSVDARSDLFGLGCVLYAMCTGRPPFRADNSYAILRMITDDEPRSIREINPDIPEWLCLLISRLMAKSPDARFGNAIEVAALLEQCLAHVQQPTSVPLPASLVPHAAGRRSIFNVTRKGVIAMLGTIGMTLLGMVLWQATEAPDISGQWTSDEWGTVVLDAKEPGQYEGPFTGTGKDKPAASIDPPGGGPGVGPFGFGDRPMSWPDLLSDSDKTKSGTLHLKWSRIERRFNGTWGKNNYRSGKLSLRLVGDEIRGGWTTDKDAAKESGTPRLGDLLWTRSQETVGQTVEPATRLAASELEKQIQLKGRELFYGRMELSQEFATLWPTKDQKLERVTSKGTARWLKQDGMTRIESDRMVPETGTNELQPEQWTTGQDGDRDYSWNRVTNSISYGVLRPGAIAYAPNLFFWGRSTMAFPHPMFGPNPRITLATRDGRDEVDVVVEDPQTKISVRYVGIVPDRGYLPTRVETRTNDRLESQVEFQDFFQPRPGVWAAKTVHWTAWSSDEDADGKPIVASRTKFTVTKLELGKDAKLQDDEFKLKLPDDVKVVDAATANAAAASPADETAAIHPPIEFRIAVSKADLYYDGDAWFPIMEPRSPAPARKSGANVPIEKKINEKWRGLLWHTTEHTLLADGTWRVVQCDVARSAQSTDLVPSFEIQITLDAAGGALLRRLTSTHLNQSLAIVVDGTIVAAPVLRTEFGEDFVITGNFSKSTAEKLADAIRKPDQRKRATFGFRFADAKSALAALKDEAASRKIRGFEATIDVRLNTVTITADADTLKELQEILGRIDSADDPKPDASLNATSIFESFVHAGKPLHSPTPAKTVVCKVQLNPNLVSDKPQIDSLLAVTLAGQDLTLPTTIELPNPDSARFLSTVRPHLRDSTLTFQTSQRGQRSSSAHVHFPALFTFSLREQRLSWPVRVKYEQSTFNPDIGD